MLRRIRAMVVATAVIACAPAATPAPSPVPTAFTGDIDVGGGRTIHIVCSGPVDPARPTIVFENGGGAELDTWAIVRRTLETTDRSCAYDRAGIGKSPKPQAPRTVRDQVGDLAAALAGAGVTGQIVLVAHSSGGWNAIVYAADHPDQVVGAVLVDIQPPGLADRLLAEFPPEAPGEPEPLHRERIGLTTFRTDPSMNPENLRIAAGEEEARAAPGFGSRPTEILWSTDETGRWEGLDADLAARLNAAIEAGRPLVEALANDPNVTRVDTGHFIHEERPDLVVEAIRRVLAALGAATPS